MIEALQAKAKAAEEAVQRAEAEQKKRAAERERKRAEPPCKPAGPTPQPQLSVFERAYTLDDADRVCPSCGAGSVR